LVSRGIPWDIVFGDTSLPWEGEMPLSWRYAINVWLQEMTPSAFGASPVFNWHTMKWVQNDK
jgi:hypothetical protein